MAQENVPTADLLCVTRPSPFQDEPNLSEVAILRLAIFWQILVEGWS